MYAFTLSAALFAAASAATNIITFQSLDDVDRIIYSTGNAGYTAPDPVTVAAGSSVDVEFSEGFVGNSYAIHSNATNNAGMLAEVQFQGWNGLTYFDVSAIVDSSDVDNVKEMYPASSPSTPVSGCTTFPCNNAYYLSDDVQTKTTEQTHLIVTLSKNGVSSKRSAEDSEKTFDRRFIQGHN